MKKTVVDATLTLAERSSARWLLAAVVAMLTIGGVALPATTAGASTATDPDFYDVTDLYGTTVIGPPLRFFLINEHFPAGAECQYQGSVGETELRCLFLATYFQDANLSCIHAADEAQLYPFNAVDLGEGGDCWTHTVDPSTMTSDARVRVLAEAGATGVDGREWVFDHWELTNAESPCENGLEHHDCTFDPVDGSQFEVHAFYRPLGSVAPQVTPM